MNGAGYGIGANNPYNPFGVDLVGNPAQYCPDGKTLGGVAVASCTPNYLLSQFSETLPPAYDRVSRDNIDTETLRMGLNGVFNAIGSAWHWETGFNYGRTYDTAQDTGFTNIERAVGTVGFARRAAVQRARAVGAGQQRHLGQHQRQVLSDPDSRMRPHQSVRRLQFGDRPERH